MVRFAINPSPKKAPSAEPFAAQLALARVHPCLVALERTPRGYAVPADATRGWFELYAKRGLACYGLARALRMLLDALTGLAALEDTRTDAGQPFVHGELVPAMLRVDPSGRARLVPLAPWHWSALGMLPAPERCGHLAPERLLGDAIDARSDVFSAGALLWEALAGRRLFENESVDSIVMRLMGDKITLPQLPPELSWALPLKAVAMCALSVDPEQRFATCAELAEAIEAVAGDQVATHAEVADYFGTPDPVTRPSMSARPWKLPTHLSSLSALVAPVAAPEPPAFSPAEPVSRGDSAQPERRQGRSVWAIAAISCVVSAVGVSAVARYNAWHGVSHSAAQSAPPLGESLPAAFALPAASGLPAASAPLPGAPLALPAAAAAAPLEAAAAPLEPTPTAAEPELTPNGPSKSPKGPAKAAAPRLKSPAKALRAAAKYGI